MAQITKHITLLLFVLFFGAGTKTPGLKALRVFDGVANSAKYSKFRKLADNLPSSYTKKLDGLSEGAQKAFLDDVAKVDDITKVVREDLLEAYDVLINRKLQRLNQDLLQKTDDILRNPKLGLDKNELTIISQKHLATGNMCGNCVVPFDMTLENIKYLSNHVDNPADFGKILDDLTGTTRQFRGADWSMSVFKEKGIKGKLKKFDFKPDGENFTIDIVTQDGTKFFYTECKNYGRTTVNWLKTSGNNFVSQFASRLKLIDDFEQLKFFFHPRYGDKLKDDIIEAFKAKKDLLNEVFNSGKLQSLMQDEIITSIDDFIEYFSEYRYFTKVIN
jgi:hypothetical protein